VEGCRHAGIDFPRLHPSSMCGRRVSSDLCIISNPDSLNKMIILDGAQFGTGNQLMQVESKKLDVNIKWLLIGQQCRIDHPTSLFLHMSYSLLAFNGSAVGCIAIDLQASDLA
jgi:hypothetical protein